MDYNRFSIKVTLKILGLGLVIWLFMWSLRQDHLIMTKGMLAAIIILQLGELIHYVNKTNRNLTQFLQSLRYLDELGGSIEKDRSFRELSLTYNQIIRIIREARFEKESEHRYFQNTIAHLAVGVIAFNENDEVEIANHAALAFLGRHHLRKLSQLEMVQPGLDKIFRELEPGRHQLLTLTIAGEQIRLSLKKVRFTIKNRPIHLISLQNVKSELEEEELEAWQKLIRVLSHEIINSVTPIKSLTSTLIQMLQLDGAARSIHSLEPETILNVLEGLQAIDRRSKGLLNFVESYRRLTRIPNPVNNMLPLKELFTNIYQLMKQELEAQQIRFEMTVIPESLTLYGDEKLLTQVIINLLINSIQALEARSERSIRLTARCNTDNQIEIQVRDNGPGIAPEIADQVFIPFFTTRPNGSGIGLSLSKQIMRLHHGSIQIHSLPEQETTVSLRF